ncbi:MAG: putative nucleotidyltransferase substrate binding domain-containing protein [Desulfuromonadaceae bacterium]|nr:putative nucleotidyltransferase substrate binding domain-containing protein [Desulfuromonadaceae bacterium]
MAYLLSAKGGDVTAWRGAENFAARYRQALLDHAVSDRNGSAGTVFSKSLATLERLSEEHLTLLGELDRLLKESAAAPPTGRLKELTGEYYAVLYRHMDAFHSAPAFYQKSMEFIRSLSRAIMAHSIERLGCLARQLPEMALVALGPAGRSEYSPFCQLQLLLVYEEAATSQLQAINLYCETLHAEFEEIGLAIDPAISPRNPEWRGSIAEWRQRCDDWLYYPTTDSFINILRLADQYSLTPGEEVARKLKEMTFATLRDSKPAQANLIGRMGSLSNGLGVMGGLKLERSGAERGLFRLLDYGLLPLSAAFSALALVRGSSASGSCDRVLDLLERRELDVDLAEEMLETWHSLHELRLRREQAFSIVGHTNRSLLLNPGELTAGQRQSLKTALASVTSIQRHVAILFPGMGE